MENGNVTKLECVMEAMSLTGWGEQPLPRSDRWSEFSTGCPAKDLQTAFDWNKPTHGNFEHWTRIFLSLKHWSNNRIILTEKRNTPDSYHSICLFRVVGWRTDPETVKNLENPVHFIGVYKGSSWLHRDVDGCLEPFVNEPVVDAWAYIN